MESQICASNKLLLAMGLKPASTLPEKQGLPPLSTWYADLFNFSRHKILIFYNPVTGYGMVAARVKKKQLCALGEELLRTFEGALKDDGVSLEKANELLAAVANPNIRRTSDRKTRGHIVHAIRDLRSWMDRMDMGDTAALERAAHVGISHGISGPTWDPIKAFGEKIGETLENRLRWRP